MDDAKHKTCNFERQFAVCFLNLSSQSSESIAKSDYTLIQFQSEERLKCLLLRYYVLFLSIKSMYFITAIRVSFRKDFSYSRSSPQFLISETRRTKFAGPVSQQKSKKAFSLLSAHRGAKANAKVIYTKHTTQQARQNICTYLDASHTSQIVTIGNEQKRQQ